MNPGDRQKIKAIIIKQMADLEKIILKLRKESTPIAPDSSIGRITRMEAINEKAISDANLRKSECRLQQLKKTHQAIDSDDFGICVRCDEPISIKRLEIIPESQVCMNCIRQS